MIRRDLCMWLCTSLGDYAMLLPHTTFVDQWEKSLFAYGQHGLAAKFYMWPTGGTRPRWWDDHWKDSWPFDRSPLLKRRPSLPTAELEAIVRARDEAGSAGGRWIRLGPRGDHRRPGEPRSHLNQLDPWILALDAGLSPTRALTDGG